MRSAPWSGRETLADYSLTFLAKRLFTVARDAASGYCFSCSSSRAILSSSGGWVENHDPFLLALAASSTLAGNLLVMGAASNVIVIQNGERLGAHLGYWEFARVGLAVTLLQMVLFYPFLRG